MGSVLTEGIRKVRSTGACALIPFLTAGFPNAAICRDLIGALADGAADVLELGVPCSNPAADGPTIAASFRAALEGGTTPLEVFDMVSWAKARFDVPIVLTCYCEPILALGMENFTRLASDSGVNGVIVPDLPVDDAKDWIDAARKVELDTVFVVGPDTPSQDLPRSLAETRGFLYFRTTSGPTGGRSRISNHLLERVRGMVGMSPVPVSVGFGISAPDQARTLATVADGVVVGSEFIRRIAQAGRPADQLAAVMDLAYSLREALAKPAESCADRHGSTSPESPGSIFKEA